MQWGHRVVDRQSMRAGTIPHLTRCQFLNPNYIFISLKETCHCSLNNKIMVYETSLCSCWKRVVGTPTGDSRLWTLDLYMRVFSFFAISWNLGPWIQDHDINYYPTGV